MFTEGIFPIGDGLLDVDEQLLKGLLVPHDINDIYDVEQTPFARGKFAAVRRAIHKNSGVHFAAKFLKRRRRAQSSDKEIKHEIAVLMLCDGAENIVKLNAVHESRSDTALLLELATGGELQTFLDNEECLSEEQARYCMREVLKGLQYLHMRSIAHLDLKPQNILLTGENIEDGLKLCDFGISRVVAEGSNVREIVGTPDYVAPEVLQYEPLSLLTDIWSVGVLAYVLLTGFSPFGGDTKQETFLNISQCALEFPDKLFGGVSSAAIDFIRRALRIKPNDRMTAAGCLEHIWLKDECAIVRQVYNIAQIATTNGDLDADVDGCETAESSNNEDDDDDVENVEQIENMESSDVELDAKQAKKLNGIVITKKNKTQTTTAVHTLPATRATTIPLCTHLHQKHQQQKQQQQQQQQQQQHIQTLFAARRHSSDANKENTYLATKKIQPTTAHKKQLQQTTATIIIGSTTTTTVTVANTITAATTTATTITNCCHVTNGLAEDEGERELKLNMQCNGNSGSHSLFPDAPTTPKVIRKAPTNDDNSPTSVKALVKKFQLEGGNTANNSATNAHLNAVVTTDKCVQTLKQQQLQQQPQPVNTVNGSRKSTSTTTTTFMVNGSQNRRASESHINGKTSITKSTTASPNSSPTSYKSTCVYCLTCGATSNNSAVNGSTDNATNGCRHSAVTANTPTNGSKTSLIPLYHHHHRHHQHYHHHELVVAKNAGGAAATSNLSLDQGIIC